ncbi:BamA/TamA family outer membrane protein [Cytophagales bacterium LB-30]|uniref:BamA/TamA family outer membrane protein n=1 Tax=Shiella aurantiaca TaxID=3058365 RepID=A0ABT8F3P5_9BACT|nr:BamA/TamA family outer membrane protein [Shiella aurantiaca]MDN4164894.1 BamA/TamA family outer membrane protein [Shiella aurantiaca]
MLSTIIAVLLSFQVVSGPDSIPPFQPSVPVKVVGDSIKEEFVRIQRVIIVGNTKTREQIIKREFDFEVGSTYLRSELLKTLQKDKSKIFNTRLFVSVDVRLIDLSPGQVEVLVDVSERWYFFPSPIFKLADRNFNDWWQNQNANLNRVEYGVRLQQDNLRGMNEKLRVMGQFGFTRQFAVGYLFPYINKKQTLGLSFNFGYSENYSIAYRSLNNKLQFVRDDKIVRNTYMGNFAFTFREAFYNTHYVQLEYMNNWVSDTISTLNPDYFLDGRNTQEYLRFRYEFKRDLRDIAAYPLSGFLLHFRFRNYGLGLSKDISKTDFEASFDRYLRLKHNFFVSFSSTASYSIPKRIPYNEFQGLGFNQNYLRGYELYVMEGHGYGLLKSNIKYRLLNGKLNLGKFMPLEQFRTVPYGLFLKAYIDQGYVLNRLPYPGNERLMNTYLIGYGLGIDYVSFYDAVIRFEFSQNRMGERGFFLHFKADL